MSAYYVYSPRTFTFTNEHTLEINHNFNRKVNYQVFVDNKIHHPEYEYVNDKRFDLKFYVKEVLIQMSGYIIIG